MTRQKLFHQKPTKNLGLLILVCGFADGKQKLAFTKTFWKKKWSRVCVVL